MDRNKEEDVPRSAELRGPHARAEALRSAGSRHRAPQDEQSSWRDTHEKKVLTDKDVAIDGTLPHQISAPDYKRADREMEKPFVNEFGVVIGDSFYDSPESPLNQWSTETDPAVMAGDRWVHPTNDIGWNRPENRELLENRRPNGVPFMHPTKDVSYRKD